MTTDIPRHLALQARACEALGSPFSAGLLDRAAEAYERETVLQQAFRPWRRLGLRELFAEAVALRWLGALHDHALANSDSALASAYPAAGRPGDPEAAWAQALPAMVERRSCIARFMRHEPQTNEVGRSAVLLPGFLEIAAGGGPPMRLLEVGASAGLNLLWDRRRYRLGEVGEWGPHEATLAIETEWRGRAPALHSRPRIAARQACDRRPVRLADPVQRRRLRAFVWPDQFNRAGRLDTAVVETLAARLHVTRADAPTWLRHHAAPVNGRTTVVFHSVFFQYMPAEGRRAMTDVLEAYGADTTVQRPLAWLRMEPSADNPAIMELRLTRWPDGGERLLATAHPHGAWIEWLD